MKYWMSEGYSYLLPFECVMGHFYNTLNHHHNHTQKAGEVNTAASVSKELKNNHTSVKENGGNKR